MIEPADAGLDRTLRNALVQNAIPPCPAVLQKIAAEMRLEDPDLRRVVQAIASDVALAAGLIKTANSPFFGTRRRTTSVMDAVMILGLDAVSRAVACIELEKLFPNPRGVERFWDASARIAELTGWLSRDRRWPAVKAEDAYTFGLFRDAGIAVLIQRFPDYVSVLRHANASADRPFVAVEDEVMPTNHTTIGAMLSQSWWLPDLISDAIGNHHTVPLPDPQSAESGVDTAGTLAALAQLAEYLLQSVTGKCITREWDKLGPGCLARLGMTEDEIPALIEGAREVLRQER